MSTKEKAEALRKAYKAKGWNSRMITVRVRSVTYSMAIDVTIRSAAVNYAEAKAMLLELESRRWCEASGEELLGGNTYVGIEYAKEVLEPVCAKYKELIAPLEPGEWKEIDGVEVSREKDEPNTYHLVAMHADGMSGTNLYGRGCWGAAGAAEGLALFKLKGQTA